ncbi:DciA family protein [Roseibium polysiphoniae]|uniref:DUF721 domain-containing protein n=1 Tax=Roseibium polysiphoniae TaxID=2571221 RepID=UPI00329922E8
MRARQGAKPLADLVGKAMTPACRKRGFASVDILAAWPDIVGERYGERVQPDRIIWPRRTGEDGEMTADPATLVVHTDGATALMLSHETRQLIERINTFYGWAAIGRIKITQKPVEVRRKPKPRALRSLTGEEEARLESQLETVANDRLREALKKLGTQVIARSGDDKV